MKNINGDIRIGGREEPKISTIKTPLGFKTHIEGAVNIIDRSPDPEDKAGLTINNKSPLDFRSTRIDPTASGNVNVLDDDQIVVFTTDSVNALNVSLPNASAVHPKQYIIQFTNTNGIRNVGSYRFMYPSSMTFQSDGNNWIILDSHNFNELSGTYYAPVKINAQYNQLFTNLEAGFTLNGYTLQEGDRILLDRQTAKIQNGLFIIRTGISPLRTYDFKSTDFFSTGIIFSTENKKTFRITNRGRIDIDDIDVVEVEGHERKDEVQFGRPVIGMLVNGNIGVVETVALNILPGELIRFTLNTSNFDPSLGDIVDVWCCEYLGNGFPIVSTRETDEFTIGFHTIDVCILNGHPTDTLDSSVKIAYQRKGLYFTPRYNNLPNLKPVPTDGGGDILALVSDIIANTGNDITGQNYFALTKNAPIKFDGRYFYYQVDGGDGGLGDSTTLGMNPSKSLVEFTPVIGSNFFGFNGNIIRMAVQWRNWAVSRFFIFFSNLSQYDPGYVRNQNTFAMLSFNGNVSGNATRMFWIYYDNSNNPQLHKGIVNFSAATIAAFAASATGDPVLIDLERLSNAEIKVTLRDIDGNTFTGQSTLVANYPTSTFTSIGISNDTNNDSIFVGDITHIFFEEAGATGASEIDISFRKL